MKFRLFFVSREARLTPLTHNEKSIRLQPAMYWAPFIVSVAPVMKAA